MLDDKDAKNTKRSTDTAVRAFRSYLAEKEVEADFENFDSEKLDNVLCNFFAESRQKNGELYKKSSLISLRHGLNRHLENVDIVKGVEFKKSQKMFQAMSAELKRQGVGGVQHHPPIEKADLEKLYASFNVSDPESLQQKVSKITKICALSHAFSFQPVNTI